MALLPKKAITEFAERFLFENLRVHIAESFWD
jgi:hypothetical protein